MKEKMLLKKDDHILFIGDSITHAHRRPEEYHDVYYLGCGYAKMLAARLNFELPGLTLRVTNRGECGHTTQELDTRWETDCIALQPTVVSILIGINDAGRFTQSVSDFETRYRGLIDRTRNALPDVRIVVLEPFALAVAQDGVPVPVVDHKQLDRVPEFRRAVRSIAEKTRCPFVPLQDAFDTAAKRSGAKALALDGIHPSAAGHYLIAANWYKTVIG